MTLTVREATENLTVLDLEGQLDIAGAQEIEIPFLAQTAARRKPVILDFSGVCFLASFGLRLLVSAHKTLHRDNLPMVILHPSPDVEKVLLMAGMENLFFITHDEAAARARAVVP